ncbi:MAG: IS5/IS1182 family transposase, partial [Culicoidibacterales bacterium]
MTKKLQENYTTLTTRYQLALNLVVMTYIDKNDPVRLLSGILEGLNYTKLLSTYSENGRNSAVPPVILFK